MEPRSFLALIVGGLIMLALGRGLSQEKDTRRAGMAPLGLAIQGIGLALITYAIVRLVKAAG